MTSKLIGFTISKKKIDHEVDFFNVGFSHKSFFKNGYYIKIWGINNIDECIIDKKYFFSFPLNDNLLDRNIKLEIVKNKIIIENDFLGSIPIYYNLNEEIISTLPKVCNLNNEISEEGLKTFLNTGFSVFGKTIFKDTEFLRYFSKIIVRDGFKISSKKDPFDKLDLKKIEDPNISLNLIKKAISNVENQTNEKIVIPTSGGYDSRLLNIMVDDKKRIEAYSYGISKQPKKSREAVYAKKITSILNIKWDLIEIKNISSHIKMWNKIFGFSTHLHGMYHIDFYLKILNKIKGSRVLLSGIVGDLWAGSISFNKEIFNLSDITYSHQVKYSKSKAIKITDLNISKYKTSKPEIVALIRNKLILLNYLITIPEYLGIPSYSPFLNFEIIKSMISIDFKLKRKRKWQQDFFKKNNLFIEDLNLKSTKSNYLDYLSIIKDPYEKINIKLVNHLFNEKVLININDTICEKKFKYWDLFICKIFNSAYIGSVFRKLGLKSNIHLLYYDYLVIKSIELNQSK